MAGKVPPERVRRLAAGLSVSRDVFARAFDDSAFVHGNGETFKQVAAERAMAEPAGDGRPRDQLDFAAAMGVANQGGWLVDFVFEKFADLAARVADDQRPVLQSIANRKQRFEDARQVEAGTLAAMRRCCLILSEDRLAGGDPRRERLGSGFLIGPHLVLTCFHVIAPLVDPATRRPRADGPALLAQFDYHEGPDASPLDVPADPADWLIAASPNVAAAEAETADKLAKNLDFAVLRLRARPGDARGFYDLGRVKAPPDIGLPVELWQFPAGQPMKVTVNNRADAPAALGFQGEAHPRIYYLANALPGSSGGLVLGPDKEPVGLHDAGFSEAAQGDQRVNRAVPLHLVAAEAATPVSQALGAIPAKLGWHPRRPLPLIGRQRLQDCVFAAQRGPGRIITVVTRPDPDTRERKPRIGRSFTRQIVESCLEPESHHVLAFPASRIDPDPFVTAQRIVAAMDPARVGELPGATGETTVDADATGNLVDKTVQALMAAAPGKTVWLIIDDIDAHPIGTQWGSSTYLVALYRRIAAEARLRVVLTGLPRRLEGLSDLEGAILEETLDDRPSEREITDWFDAHLASDTRSDEFTWRITRLISFLADEDLGRAEGRLSLPPVHSQTEALAGLIERHARKAFANGRRG